MLLTRSLPPQFLLPAWNPRQLAQVVQRAFKTYNHDPDDHHHRDGKDVKLMRKDSAYSGSGSRKYVMLDRAELQQGRVMGASRSIKLSSSKEPSNFESLGLASYEPAERPPGGIQLQSNPPQPPRSTKQEKMPVKETARSEPLSLFEELFPEEALAQEKKLKRALERLDKLPAFKWDGEFGVLDQKERARANELAKRKQIFSAIPARAEPKADCQPIAGGIRKAGETRRGRRVSVLVLKACSKTLEETDFFRVGPQGNHVQGWTSGIIKVIPARDNSTLEPLGQYFLLFSSDAAARAYLDRTIQLHNLSRATAGGEGIFASQMKDGEDATALRNFSLVPATGKLSLKMVERPYSAGLAWMIDAGGPAALVARQDKAQAIVLFSTDKGYVAHYELLDALSRDGKRRNLHWMLGEERKQAIVKLKTTKKDTGEDGRDLEDDMPRAKSNYRGPARYTISFKDSNEARRFVREWHRRPFPTNREANAEDEEPPIVHAEVLW